jgi:CheY-like chemotaxis protein
VKLVIKVKDTGIGIPEDQLQHIFDRFYQVDNSHTRRAEGTGIGLALTRELVKLMGGEIVVTSPPAGANKGTEFTVTLPLMLVPVTEDLVVKARGNQGNQLKQHTATGHQYLIANENRNADMPLILLVEDNADVAAYTAACLPDYRLAIGKDGQEGFDIATEVVPDIIITDVMMPFVDGFELCRRLKNNEHTSHIPIIMLTAKADIESKIEGLQQGADAYLQKPFNKEELVVRVKKMLELRKNLQQYYLRTLGLNYDTPPGAIIAEA